MIGVVSTLLTGLGRRLTFWGALSLAIVVAVWVAVRRGRHAAEADFAIRRAEARIRALHTAREVTHEVQNSDRIDLDRRVDRWMRD